MHETRPRRCAAPPSKDARGFCGVAAQAKPTWIEELGQAVADALADHVVASRVEPGSAFIAATHDGRGVGVDIYPGESREALIHVAVDGEIVDTVLVHDPSKRLAETARALLMEDAP